MDFGNLAVHGRSPTRTSMVTNPIRRLLWWMISPYFRAAGNQINERIDGSVHSVTVHFDEKLHAASASWQHAFNATVQESVRAAVGFQLAGMRKDLTASAYRLAGLEEEAAATAQARQTLADQQNRLLDSQNKLADHQDKLRAHLNDTVDFVKALQQELHSSLQGRDDRLGELTRAKDMLHYEIRAAVQSLTERIDSLTRGEPLRAGDRIAVGEGSLVIAASPAGTRFLVRQSDLIGRLIVDGQEWEPHVRTAIEHASRPDAIAVDAGAYIGLHTVTMSRWFRTVHAFEPQRGIFQMLCGNLALNGRTNVEAYKMALYDRAGSMRLAPQERQEVSAPVCNGQPDYDHIANAAALSFDFVADGSGEVQAIALDDMALDGVALIKVDAQGADLRILQGARETIRRSRPTVLFEWERDLGSQHGTNLDDYYAFFREMDYDVILLQDTSPGRQADFLARPRQ